MNGSLRSARLENGLSAVREPKADAGPDSAHPAYRPEIDGLRAIAVLSVVGFHAFPGIVPGGFVGVDVFFVISGYLISGIIFRGVDAGRFTYSDFYSRRIRRIFPALGLMLTTTLAAAMVFMFPAALAQLGLHAAAGTAFVSNILLWTQSGYFDLESANKPLLHLWSLGIEEQYYLIWPLLIGFAGTRLPLRLATLVVLFLGSFALNLALLPSHPVAVFYMPFTRFWELHVGSGLAYGTLYGTWGDRSARAGEAAGWIGLALLAVAIATLRADQPFPGWRALLPTVGAALLIFAGRGAWVNRRLLSARPAVFVGLISYPLYLWHWPLLVLPRLYLGSADRNVRIAAVLASILSAWLTYRFVELPIRENPARRRTAVLLLVTVAAVGMCGLIIFLARGVPQRFPAALQTVATADQEFDYARYRHRQCFLDPEQGPAAFRQDCEDPSTPGHNALILIWGDSHAASLYPGFRAVLDEDRLPYRLAQRTASACPPVLGFVVTARPLCRSINDATVDFIAREHPDTVVMLASWSFYSGDAFDRLDLAQLARTAARVRALGVRRVLVLGPLPRWLEHQPDVVLRDWRRTHEILDRTTTELDPSLASFDAALRAALPADIAYVSPLRRLCDAHGCKVLTTYHGRLEPLAWDDAHLTVAGSEVIARAVLPDIER